MPWNWAKIVICHQIFGHCGGSGIFIRECATHLSWMWSTRVVSFVSCSGLRASYGFCDVRMDLWQLHGPAVAGLFVADDHVRRLVLVVVVAGWVVVRRRVHRHGRRRLRLILLLLLRLLHFLHLDDLGVAELLAEAADEAHRVDAVADHLNTNISPSSE